MIKLTSGEEGGKKEKDRERFSEKLSKRRRWWSKRRYCLKYRKTRNEMRPKGATLPKRYLLKNAFVNHLKTKN